MEWHPNYFSRKRSDIAQELADFRTGIGACFSITFDLQRSVTPVALEFGSAAALRSSTRIRIWIHPTTVGERRAILMRLKMMGSMAALALCATGVNPR
jgi:hypothetical protein